MKKPISSRPSLPEFALPFGLALALFVPAARAQKPPAESEAESVLSRTVRIVEENNQKLDRVIAGVTPDSARLDEAMRAVDAALARTDLPERERLANAAKAKDEVIGSIDAILAHEEQTKSLFGAQIDTLRAAWLRASRGGTGAATDQVAKENRDKRKEVAAAYAVDPDTPPEWRELFEMAFELLELDESGLDELGEQEQAMMQETLAALDQMRREFYLSYAEQARAFNSLRTLRRSEALQKDLLLSGKDLEALREVGRAARDSVLTITKRGGGSKGTLDEIRKSLDRLRKDRSKPATAPRTPEQQRRSLLEFAERFRDRIAKAGK